MLPSLWDVDPSSWAEHELEAEFLMMGRPIRKNPPGGGDHAKGSRSRVERQIHWHPPMVQPDDAQLRKPAAIFAGQKKHPRASLIGATEATRLMYSCQIWDATAQNDGSGRMPPCCWCGMPTGCFCDGIAATESEPGFDCTVALCTVCDKFLGLCVDCTRWSGTPTTVDKRINFKSVEVKSHEEPGVAVTAMLQGRTAPRGSEPRSWKQLQLDAVLSHGDQTQRAC